MGNDSTNIRTVAETCASESYIGFVRRHYIRIYQNFHGLISSPFLSVNNYSDNKTVSVLPRKFTHTCTISADILRCQLATEMNTQKLHKYATDNLHVVMVSGHKLLQALPLTFHSSPCKMNKTPIWIFYLKNPDDQSAFVVKITTFFRIWFSTMSFVHVEFKRRCYRFWFGAKIET